MLVAAKYRRQRAVGRRLCAEAAAILASRVPAGTLLPVPLTRAKRRERGFNQSEDFALEIARVTGQDVRTDWLVRRRGGRPLAGRPREERADAVRGAFARAPGLPLESIPPLILVDDVVTSGSTAAECILTLREGGGRVRAVVAMARARDAHDDAPSLDWTRLEVV
jgi:predicted amidophosphoribosyltransferase